MKNLTPRQIVEQLDQYIIGQAEAKRSVAVALRNRWRSMQLPPEMEEEIIPKNILLIGPTGVGKTEIARRIAKLTDAPFVKVEATKYTEVGYVGRDVESMIRDLAEEAVRMVKNKEAEKHKDEAAEAAVVKIADILWPVKKREETRNPMEIIFGEKKERPAAVQAPSDPVRDEKRKALMDRIRSGELDSRTLVMEVPENSGQALGSIYGDNENMNQLSKMFSAMMPKKMKKRKMTVRAAKKFFREEAAAQMVDMEAVAEKAVEAAEKRGIVFIDEIDKVAGRGGSSSGPDVSREGVQRDILPIVEGATVKTKYGPVKTDHILFMAAGAFHVSKPSDLIPELQGRFPIRVELKSLTKEDFRRILTEPRQALIRQYTALLETEGVHITFQDDALDEVADMACRVNADTEDIGARRLYTMMERLLEDISFEAPDLDKKELVIDRQFVKEKLSQAAENIDISQYIL